MEIALYVDESGDLGTSPASSKFICFGLVAVKEGRQLQNKLRKLRKKLGTPNLPEFKWSMSSRYIKKKVLETLNSCDCDIFGTFCDKSKVKTGFIVKKNNFYEFILQTITRIATYRLNKKNKKQPLFINIVLDRCMSDRQIASCNSYLRSRLNLLGYGNIKFAINHVNSRSEAGIQFADFVAGAIHEKCRINSDNCLDIIKDKLIVIHEMFKQDFK